MREYQPSIESWNCMRAVRRERCCVWPFAAGPGPGRAGARARF